MQPTPHSITLFQPHQLINRFLILIINKLYIFPSHFSWLFLNGGLQDLFTIKYIKHKSHQHYGFSFGLSPIIFLYFWFDFSSIFFDIKCNEVRKYIYLSHLKYNKFNHSIFRDFIVEVCFLRIIS